MYLSRHRADQVQREMAQAMTSRLFVMQRCIAIYGYFE
jgi:hypothetical protein